MHELSLLEGVLQTLEQQAEQQQFTRIKNIVLQIGALSCVEPEALRFAFDVVMNNSLAEQAELQIIIEPGRGFCRFCKNDIELESLHQPCSQCGRFDIKISAGQEMKIKQITVV